LVVCSQTAPAAADYRVEAACEDILDFAYWRNDGLSGIAPFCVFNDRDGMGNFG
jgi:hypothetical protein